MSEKFAEALKEEENHVYTENGAKALKSTSDVCLDLFGLIGALRNTDANRIETLFAEAYKENPLTATRIAFYARDIRGGLGEREVFRTIIRYMAEHHPEAIKPNLDLIGVYGRYDDLYVLIGTPVEEDMWKTMKTQFEEDRKNLEEGNAVSLLAKWIKSADASSDNTRRLGILTAQKLGYSVYDFKRIVKRLRKHIGIVESLMSAGKWDEIKYSAVPSRAMMIYRQAFCRHDSDRFTEFISKATEGKEKINSATLYPYDIVEKILYGREDNKVLEAQWKQLPDYVNGNCNAIVVADVSGSMCGRPLATSVGLAIYFAERNTGAFHDLFMTFSDESEIVRLKGETLFQKIRNAANEDWNNSTNLEAAFLNILEIAIAHHIPQEEMPKSVIVISDMEINSCASDNWSFYDSMKEKYADSGYEIPNVVFWNVNSRQNLFLADGTRKGVQLCSGQSPSTFKVLMDSVGLLPSEMMDKIVNSERYQPITVD